VREVFKAQAEYSFAREPCEAVVCCPFTRDLPEAAPSIPFLGDSLGGPVTNGMAERQLKRG
jgi:hypothetical protein